jgi:phage terminase large subunit
LDIELPEILNIPPKLIPFIVNINDFKYFLAEGGRGSAKTQSIARIILYLAEQDTLRIACARETQSSIEDSVHAVFADLIRLYDLNWTIQKNVLTHNETKTEIKFKGFREQGAVNIKGLEGVDILWIEEAQSITKLTLDIIIPTIRKNKAKIFISMNRYIRSDPVYETLAGRADCLTVKINYIDNPFCPDVLIQEAEEMRSRNIRDFNHIWLGIPLEQGDDYLYNSEKLDAMKTVCPENLAHNYSGSVLSVDLSGDGGDMCVATLFRRRSGRHWWIEHVITWNNPDTDYTIGKCISLYNQYRPDEMIVDANGIGYPMFVAIQKVIPECYGFKGSKTDMCDDSCGNQRAQGYLDLKELIDAGLLRCEDVYLIKELSSIRRNLGRQGKVYLVSKQDMRKQGIQSPDRADSAAMGAFAITRLLDLHAVNGCYQYGGQHQTATDINNT